MTHIVFVDGALEEVLAGFAPVVMYRQVEPRVGAISTSHAGPGFPGAFPGTPRVPWGRIGGSTSH